MNPQFGTWEEAVLWLRAQSDLQELVYAAYYDDPLLAAAERYQQSDEWAAVRECLPAAKGRCVLDVGAGRGIASFALAREGFSVTALEPDESAIVGAAAIRRLAHDSHVSIDVMQAYSEALPFPDARFDVVFARAALHHTRDLEQACREFFRVLKPGGSLIAIREHVISRREDLPAFLAAHPLHERYGGENAFLLRDYMNAMIQSGFRIQRVLGPFDSAMNLWPGTPASILQELARRLSCGNEALQRVFMTFSRLRGAWPLVRVGLRAIDNRPGRLYSFVAVRP